MDRESMIQDIAQSGRCRFNPNFFQSLEPGELFKHWRNITPGGSNWTPEGLSDNR
jgi:hypothetical protein